jgi:ribosome maturation factor RimP
MTAIDLQIITREVITPMIHSWLESQPELFLVAVTCKGGRVGHKLEILVDGDQGIGIDSVVALTRHLNEALTENDPFPGVWHLEVSSPGVDYPLATERQFRKNIGRTLSLTLQDNIVVEGKLTEVGTDSISLSITEKQKGKKAETRLQTLPYSMIKKTQIIIAFK